MARSFILQKNLTPLIFEIVMGDEDLVMAGDDFSICGTVNIADFPGISILDVTPNHNFSTSKFDCLLGEQWVQMSTTGSIYNACSTWDGAQLMIHLKNPFSAIFLLSGLRSNCGLQCMNIGK